MPAKRRNPRRSGRPAAALLLAVLLLAFIPARIHAQSSYTYEECSTAAPADLRTELQTLARLVLQDERAHVDIDAIVDRQWTLKQMDQVIDLSVADAVAYLMETEPYWQRFWSGWSAGKAEEFTLAVAERALTSPVVEEALANLSAGIAEELTGDVQSMVAMSASTALACLQAYVGDRYADTLFTLFAQEVDTAVAGVDLAATGAGSTGISAAEGHSKAVAGITVIIVTQVVQRVSVQLGKRIAGRVAGRIAGRVVGRLGSTLIPLAGWLIGGSLILWDLWEGGKGSLPQIQEALQGSELKAAVRDEVSLAVQEGLDEQLDDIALVMADAMVADWEQFCVDHPTLCSLPEENDEFRSILAVTPVDHLTRLAALVETYIMLWSREALDEALLSGQIEDLMALEEGGQMLLEATGSPELTLAWAELAPARLGDIVNLQLYLHFRPEQLTPLDLETLLALTEPDQVAVMAALPASARAAFLALPIETLRTLTDGYDAAALEVLLTGAGASGRPLRSVAEDVAAGRLTPDQLDSLSVAIANEEAAPQPAVDDEIAGPIHGAEQRPVNGVLVAALIVSVVLAISAFALVALSGVKRRKY